MSNRKQNSSPLQRDSRNMTTDGDAGCGTSILFSLGTAFCVCFVTANLFNYYVGQLHRHTLNSGLGVFFIFMFKFPIIFVLAFIIWIWVGRGGRYFNDAFTSWLTSLMVGLGMGYIILLMASNNLKTDSYQDFSNNQTLIGFGFPFFSLVIYAIVLATLPRRR
jgi:hypothetical protein